MNPPTLRTTLTPVSRMDALDAEVISAFYELVGASAAK
jgi:hypothetical protein